MSNNTRRIEVRPYDPRWTTLYRSEADILQTLFGPEVVALHHIGSTSVPGLPAKPTIDILLEVHDIDAIDGYNDRMRALGYEPRGEYGLPRRRYFPKIVAGEHQFHVHTWQTGDLEIERHVAFRDYLIAYPYVADAYGGLKQELAARFADDRQKYMDGKHNFCQDVEATAVTWHRSIRAQTIRTERITLLPLNPAELWHYLARPNQLEAALRVPVSRSILVEPVPHAIRAKVRNTKGASVERILWNTYWLIIIDRDPFGAGLIGFKGVPDENGEVELGYGIDSQVRRQGYVTEANRALVEWALAQPACQAVTAFTEKDNAASIRVLEKSGFSLARETSDELCWVATGTRFS